MGPVTTWVTTDSCKAILDGGNALAASVISTSVGIDNMIIVNGNNILYRSLIKITAKIAATNIIAIATPVMFLQIAYCGFSVTRIIS